MPHQNLIREEIFVALKHLDRGEEIKAKEVVTKILQDKNDETNLQYIAYIYLILGQFSIARDTYLKAKSKDGEMLSSIFLQDLQRASKLIKNLEDSPSKSWGIYLLNIFQKDKKQSTNLTFLTVRNFLEMTIYLLLKSQNHYYLELLLKDLDNLTEINIDSEKYVGSAYYNFRDYKSAVQFLTNAAQKNPYDGEIFFILGKVYLALNLPFEALDMLQNARLLLGEHYPTKVLIEKAEGMLG